MSATIYAFTYGNYRCRAVYLKTRPGDAEITITRRGEELSRFLYPAYKVWNIAAHFGDIAQDLDGST